MWFSWFLVILVLSKRTVAFSGLTGSAAPIALHGCKSLPAEQASHV